MSLQGLFGCRDFMVYIETNWQAALCFAHGCFPNLGFYFYLLNPLKPMALADWTPFKLTPVHGKPLLHFVIDTLYSQCDYSWYSWIPLVPELIGPIDQFSLNVFSIANALAFTLFN